MSSSVDNRVVSMEFDNAKFERNVETSLNTLKHLDKSLEDLTQSSRGFDGVSFENLANGIDSIANKFTLMGRVTMRVFDEIADGIVNLGKKLISFNTDQIASGWDKYADKTTSVQTIMSATGLSIDDVSEQLERLNRFTDETSYSFTDMTSNIAKFTSQGIDLDSAVTSMQGIATWAASAGQNAQAASRAMYNISQAMGAGAMKLIDWKSIQNANMATKEFKEQAIAAAVAEHQLVEENGKFYTSLDHTEVTVKNFDQTLQKGWFTSGAMTRVFNEYGKFADLIDETSQATGVGVSKLLSLAEAQKHAGDSAEAAKAYEAELADAMKDSAVSSEELVAAVTALNAEEYEFSKATYKAAQEAKTFGDAIDALKDALSTSWMNVFETIFGNYEQQRVLWTDMAEWLYDLFAEPVNSIGELLSGALDEFTGLDFKPMQGYIKDTALDLLDLGEAAEDAFKKLGVVSEADIEKYGSVREAIKNTSITAESVGNVIDRLLSGNTEGAKEGTAALEEYRQVVQDIWYGKYGSGEERKTLLEQAGYDYETAQNLLNKWHYGIEVTEEDLKGLSVTAAEVNEDEIKRLLELQEQLDTGNAKLSEYIKLHKEEGRTGRELLFDTEIGAFYNIMNIVSKLRDTISEAWNDVFSGNRVEQIYNFIAAFQALTEKIKNSLEDSEALKAAFTAIFTILKIGIEVVKNVISAVKQIIDLFKPTKDQVDSTVISISNLVVQFEAWLRENQILEKAVKKVVDVFRALRDALAPAVNTITDFIRKVKESETAAQLFQLVISAIAGAFNLVIGIVTKAAEAFGRLVSKGAELAAANLPGLAGRIKAAFENWSLERVSQTFATLKETITNFFKIFTDLIKTGNIEKFFKDMSNWFSPITEKINAAKTAFKQWFDGLAASKDAGGITGVLGKIASALGQVYANAVNLYNTHVPEIFSKIKSAFASFSLEGVIRAFVGAKDAVVEFFKILWQFIKTGDWQTFVKDIETHFGAVVKWLKDTKETIEGWFSGVDKSTIRAIASIAAGLLSFIGVLKLLKSFSSVKYAFIEFLSDVSSTIKTFARSKTIGDILKIAAAIAILAAALYVIAQIPAENLKQAVIVLGGIAAAVMAFIVVIGIFSNMAGAEKMAVIASSIALFAISIGVLVAALWALTQMNYDKMYESLKTLGIVMVMLGIMMASFSKANVSLTGTGLGVIAYAAGILLLVKALKTIQEDASVISADAFKKLGVIIGLLIGMGLAMKNVKFTSAVGLIVLAASLVYVENKIREAMENAITFEEFQTYWKELLAIFALLVGLGLVLRISGKGSLSSVLSLLALILLLHTVSKAIQELGSIPEEQVKQGTIVVTAIGLVFAALVWALGQTKGIDKSGVKAITALVIGLVALLLAVAVFAAIAENNSTALLIGLGCVVGVMLALGVAMLAVAQVMKNSSTLKIKGVSKSGNSGVAAIIALIAGVALIMAELAIIAQLNNGDELIKAAESMALLLVALSGAMYALSKCDFKDFGVEESLRMLLQMVTILVPVIAALWAIQALGIEASIQTAASLSLLIIALSVAIRIMGDSKADAEKAFASGAALTLGAIALIGIAIAMQQLNDVNLDGLILKATAMAELILAVSVALLIVSKCEADLKQVGIMALLLAEGVVALIGLAFVMKQLNDVDVDGIIEKAAGMSLLLLAISGMVLILSNMDEGTAMTAFKGGLAVLGLLGVFILELIALGALLSIGEDDILAQWLIHAAETLGEALGQFVGKFVGGLISGAMNAMADLSGFVEGIKPVITQLRRIDDKAVSGITALTKMILALAAAELIEGFNKLIGWLPGIGDTSTFTDKLVGFATAVNGYIDKLKDLDPADANKASRITEAVASLFASVPIEGGLIGFITGKKSTGFDNLGDGLKKFGGAIKDFVDSVKDIPNDAVSKTQRAVEAAKEVNAFVETLQKTGGLLQSVMGTQDVGEFGTRLTKFVKSLFGSRQGRVGETEGFFNALDNVEIDDAKIQKIGAIKEAMGPLTDLAKQIPLMGGLIEEVFGSSDPGQFAGSMTDFIKELKKIIEETDGVEESSLDKIKTIATKFTEVQTAFGEIDTTTMSTKAEELKKVITNLSFNGETSIDITGIESLKTSLSGIPEVVTTVTDSLTKATDEIKKFTDTASKDFSDMLNKMKTDADTGGKNIVSTLASAISSTASQVTSNVTSMCQSANSILQGAANVAYLYGVYYGQGFANGIYAMIGSVSAAASALASAATRSVTVSIDAHSPSRVSSKLGKFFGMGFGIGIASTTSLIEKQAEDMANVAIDAISAAKDLIDAAIENDGQPVIKPVLDMSDIEEGARSISNMRSGFIADVGLSSAQAISSQELVLSSTRNQNGTGPVTAVLSDSAIMALAQNRSTQSAPVIEFTGDLAQLARILHPVLVEENNNHGISLIKR